MKNFEQMGKVELRAACKAAGIVYGKLNNDGMRKALSLATGGTPTPTAQANADASQGIGPVAGDGRPAPIVEGARKPAKKVDGPAASLKKMDDVAAALKGKVRPEEVTKVLEKRENNLHGAVVETPVVEAGPREKVIGEVVKQKSLKIEKGRESQNDVTKPSTGSICRQIWDALDAKMATSTKAATKENEGSEEGDDAEEPVAVVPTFADLRDMMKQYGWARNTAMTQYQRWKQFHGVMPRSQDE